MQFVTFSFDYNHVMINDREKMTIDESAYAQVAEQIASLRNIHECVVMSTCNRTEVVVLTDNVRACEERIYRFLSMYCKVDAEKIAAFAVVRQRSEAVLYLFELACGVHSLVVGETQILGQLRHAYGTCSTTSAVGKWMHRLFSHCLRFAKRIHTELRLNDRPMSVAYAAVSVGRELIQNIATDQICVVGVGEMGALVVQHLNSSGAENVTIANRTEEKAQQLGSRYKYNAITIEQLKKENTDYTLIISAIGCDVPWLEQHHISARNEKQLAIIDLGVPRNIEANVGDLRDVTLYTVDDLHLFLQENESKRIELAQEVKVQAQDELYSFEQWMKKQIVVPTLSALQRRMDKIAEETMQSLERKLSHLGEKERNVIRKHMRSVLNQLMKDPVRYIKELPEDDQLEVKIDFITKLFQFEENSNQKESVR
ncbi:MAG: glutamyl-tRNA reductase [Bacilli bacterium]